jgi:hypothetical protein
MSDLLLEKELKGNSNIDDKTVDYIHFCDISVERECQRVKVCEVV